MRGVSKIAPVAPSGLLDLSVGLFQYEYIYLNAIEGGSNLRNGLSKNFEWYNQKRPHQGLGYRKPDEVYYEDLINQAVA